MNNEIVLAKLKSLHPAIARYAEEIAACEVCMNPKHDAHKPGVVWCGHVDPLGEVRDEIREPLIDKLATYADDPTQDSKGRKFPTIEEFKAAGFDPSTYDAFVAFRKKEADDAMGIKPLDDSKPASGKVDDTKAEAPGGSKGDGSAFVSKEKPEASPKAK